MKKSAKNNLQVVNFSTDKENTPHLGIKLPNKKNYKPKDILRIQSQLIQGFIKGEIEDGEAKTLSYLCSNYLQNLQFIEFEERITKLENLG